MVTSNLSPSFRASLPWVLALFAGASFAQASPPEAASQPTLLTTLQYSSPIQAYQGYVEQPVQSWRTANDRVGQIGGWRTYAKEAKTQAPSSPSQDAAPGSDPHSSHHGGGKQ